MDKASELSLELNAEPFHKHANMIATALREAEARGRASMKEEAAKVAIEIAEKDRALSGEGRSVEAVVAFARAIGAQRVAAVVLALP
jgi:hypothetical protein